MCQNCFSKYVFYPTIKKKIFFFLFVPAVHPQCKANFRHGCDQAYLGPVSDGDYGEEDGDKCDKNHRDDEDEVWGAEDSRVNKESANNRDDVAGARDKLLSFLCSPAEEERREKLWSSRQELGRRRRRCLTVRNTPTGQTFHVSSTFSRSTKNPPGIAIRTLNPLIKAFQNMLSVDQKFTESSDFFLFLFQNSNL